MSGVEFNLGEKIKKLRLELNLTLKDVAESTGFSKALISRIEHNLVSPPIATLYRISRALNVRMKDFFEEEPVSEDIWLVKAGERPKAYRDGSRYGYTYESLASHLNNEDFEPLLVTLLPENRDRAHFFSHRGYEFIYVLEGEMLFHYHKKRFLLKPGDSLFFSARVSHSGACATDAPVRAVTIRYSPPEGW